MLTLHSVINMIEFIDQIKLSRIMIVSLIVISVQELSKQYNPQDPYNHSTCSRYRCLWQ